MSRFGQKCQNPHWKVKCDEHFFEASKNEEFDPKPKKADPKPKKLDRKPKKLDPKPQKFDPKPEKPDPKPKTEGLGSKRPLPRFGPKWQNPQWKINCEKHFFEANKNEVFDPKPKKLDPKPQKLDPKP